MEGRRDIAGRDDIETLLTDFYRRVFADDLLGPIFVGIARMDLAAQLPVMCDFWQTVLFRTGHYRRNALKPHVQLHRAAQLTPADFGRWLALWTAAVDDGYAGEKAEFAKLQATRMAGAISRRLTGRPPESLPWLAEGA